MEKKGVELFIMEYRYYISINSKGYWRTNGYDVEVYYDEFFTHNYIWVKSGYTFKEITDKERFREVSEAEFMLEML